MRALKPWLGQILAVLLLMQWGGGLSACLARMAWDPAQVLCHLGPAEDTRDHGPGTTASCPVCVPLPPGTLPVPPVLPLPSAALPVRHDLAAAPRPAPPPAPPGPQQPRAPPFRA